MERLINIDRRIIFIFVFLGVAIPLLMDFHLPIKPTPTVRRSLDSHTRRTCSQFSMCPMSAKTAPWIAS